MSWQVLSTILPLLFRLARCVSVNPSNASFVLDYLPLYDGGKSTQLILSLCFLYLVEPVTTSHYQKYRSTRNDSDYPTL